MYLGDDNSVSTVRMPHDQAIVERLTAKLVPSEAVKRRRLARIRRAVASSEYENSLKLSVAVDRLIERLGNP